MGRVIRSKATPTGVKRSAAKGKGKGKGKGKKIVPTECAVAVMLHDTQSHMDTASGTKRALLANTVARAIHNMLPGNTHLVSTNPASFTTHPASADTLLPRLQQAIMDLSDTPLVVVAPTGGDATPSRSRLCAALRHNVCTTDNAVAVDDTHVAILHHVCMDVMLPV
jgi:argininosuccinate lyase